MEYLRTHPWITFRVNLTDRVIPSDFWILLGEAKSKCEHLANAPLLPDLAKQLHQVSLVKGVHGTVAIEGNTLTEDQIQQQINGTLTLPPSQEYLAIEVNNVIQAVNDIAQKVAREEIKVLSVALIKGFNRDVLKDLELGEGVVPGQIRVSSFGVAQYRGAPASECQYLLDRLCDWLNGPDFASPPGGQDKTLITAIIKAVLAHLYLEWIHPFGDGNGRTGRLLEFVILINAGLPSPAAHLLSNHYNHTRSEYYRQLDLSSRSNGDVVPFLQYAIKGFVEGLREHLEAVRYQQWQLTWKNHVWDSFKGKSSPSDERQRHLVLDMSKDHQLIPLSKLTEISPRVAKAYATKTQKTLMRDLKALMALDLVESKDGGYKTKIGKVIALLPYRHIRPPEQSAAQPL